jgi:hypothetical protein
VHLALTPRVRPNAVKNGPEVGRTSQGLAPQKVVDFWLASFVQSRPVHPGANILQHFGCVPISGIDFVADDVRAVAEEHFWRVGLRGDGPSKVSLGFVLK